MFVLFPGLNWKGAFNDQNQPLIMGYPLSSFRKAFIQKTKRSIQGKFAYFSINLFSL